MKTIQKLINKKSNVSSEFTSATFFSRILKKKIPCKKRRKKEYHFERKKKINKDANG